MRFRLLVAAAAVALSASAASAQGYGRTDRLGSNRYACGINATQPSRAIFKRCSTDYHFGGPRRHRRLHRRLR